MASRALTPYPLPFHHPLPVVGMIHLPPLPGAPGADDAASTMHTVVDAARQDAAALVAAGVDGIMVENFGDVPFHSGAVPAATVAAMTAAVQAAMSAAGSTPVGVNVLRNDAGSAVAIASATGAAYVRVNVHSGTMWTDQGPMVGRAHETLRLRKTLGTRCAILADVHVKHATPAPGETVEGAARDTWYRGSADALIVSGEGTGLATDPARIERVSAAVPGAPIWVGSGAVPENLEALAQCAHGLIVGSWLMEEGQAGGRVDVKRARTFMEMVRALR